MHTIGSYLVFVTFLTSYGGRAAESLVYLPQVLAMLFVFVLRVARRVRGSRHG